MKILSSGPLTDYFLYILMSTFTPSEAPAVPIEFLPETAIAVEAEVKPLSLDHKVHTNGLIITAWAPAKRSMIGIEGSSDPDNFVSNYCEGCRYYTDEVEIDVTGEDVEVDDSEGNVCTVRGTVYAYSPCGSYENGVSEISMPCLMGHELNEDGDETDLYSKYMAYSIAYAVRDSSTYNQYIHIDEYAFQQHCDLVDDVVTVTDKYRSVNTFDPRHNICWGDNTPGDSLLQIEDIFVKSDANEDLLSFYSHNDNANDVENAELNDPRPYAIVLSTTNERAQALVCASALTMPKAFLLLASSGVTLRDSLAYVKVSYYQDVAVTDDVVMNVWATDVLPIGKRLLFMDLPNEELEFSNGSLLGQVPADFQLLPPSSPWPGITELGKRLVNKTLERPKTTV